MPSYLPEGLSLVVEKESVPPSLIGGGAGRSRIYYNDPYGSGNGVGDVIATSLTTDAAPLDVDAETARYPGARKVQVQGAAALFLPPIAGRNGWVVAWSPGPGQLAQVSLNATAGVVGGVAGLGDEDVLALAERLRLPDLDGTPLPPGFAPRDGQGSDSRSIHPPVPRQWSAAYSDVSGDRGDATAIVPSASDRHSVTITSAWRTDLPAGSPTGAVRGHDATAPSGPDTYSSLVWEERPGLQVTVTGERVSNDELRRVIAGLREQSFDEVLAGPTGAAAVVGQADVAGKSLQLWASRRPSGICVELRPSVGLSTCGFDPAKSTFSIGVTTQGAPNVVFGAARPSLKRVRIEVPGGQAVEATTFPAADATYWLAALPDGKPLAAVVAVDAGGRVVERRDVLPESPTAPFPPWSAAKVSVGDAPSGLLDAWQGDGRRDGCAALALTDESVGAGATPLIASFGPDAWAVAFDKAGLPGTTAEGQPSRTAGDLRSASPGPPSTWR